MLDCFDDWFTPLFRYSISRAIADSSTFRNAVARYVKEIEGHDLASLPPLAIAATYRVVCDTLEKHFRSSSWLDLIVSSF